MNENLKSDKESKNEAIHTESAKLEFKRNSENNNEVRLDSNGDEIMYEIWHNPNWWDYIIFFTLLFVFGIPVVCGSMGILLFDEEKDKPLFIAVLAFGLFVTSMCSHRLFYLRKNRVYVTTQGIGFERRRWFRMQKGFYRFGEAGVIRSIGTTIPVTPPNLIIIFPLGNCRRKYFFSWQLKPYCNISLTAWDFYISENIYSKVSDAYYLHDFLVKKTKEALEAKGIDTNTLCYDLGKQFDLY